MDLFEYQGKQYFARYSIPVSAGGVADTVEEAVAAADQAGYPVVVKAQVQVGGRGKAGGVKLSTTASEVRLHAGNILGLDIKGHVSADCGSNASDIAKEYYASFTLDRAAKKISPWYRRGAAWKSKPSPKRTRSDRPPVHRSVDRVHRDRRPGPGGAGRSRP